MYRLTTLFLVFFAALLVCTMASPPSKVTGFDSNAQGGMERRSLLGLILKAKIKHHLKKGVHDMKHGKQNKDLAKLSKLGQTGKSELDKMGKMGKMGKNEGGKNEGGKNEGGKNEEGKNEEGKNEGGM